MHPQRTILHNELHARPSMYFAAPAHVFHLAFLDDHDSPGTVLRALAARHAVLMDTAAPQGEFLVDGARLKWERHNEFVTLTLLATAVMGTVWPDLPPVLAELADRYGTLLINAD